MGAFRYIPPDEVAQRHRSTPPRQQVAPATRPSLPRQRNVEPVLSLGDVRYVMYRNRPFRVPPVPFKLGQRVLESHVRVLEFAKEVALKGTVGPTDEYFRELRKLATLLWKHIRPVGRVQRMFWRLRLSRNPFQSASEGELKDITNFFLQGRMKSNVRLMSEVEMQELP